MLINFFGKRGAGKTTAIKAQLKNCKPPVVVLDILGNFRGVGDVEVSEVSHMVEWIAVIAKKNHDGEKLDDRIIVVQCADPSLAVDYASAALWEAGGGTLILDEADGFSLADAPCFDQLVRYGRNRNVDLITGCRRPAEISRNITAGANQLFAFRTQEPRDIDYFRSTIFGERAEELTVVPPYHGIYVDHDTQTVGRFKIDPKGQLYKLTAENANGSGSDEVNKNLRRSREFSKSKKETELNDETDESSMVPDESKNEGHQKPEQKGQL